MLANDEIRKTNDESGRRVRNDASRIRAANPRLQQKRSWIMRASRLRKPVGATMEGHERSRCGDEAMVAALTLCRVLLEYSVVWAQDHVSDCSVEG
jgi:hypothetical protein